MNNDEAKFILRAYRPNGRDAADDVFAAALQQAREDPVLHEWFRREQAHDRIVTNRLREIAPPADLREKILTGARMSQRHRTPRNRWITAIGLAASVAVVAALAELWQGHRLEAAQETLARFTVNDTMHGNHGADHGALMQATLAMLGRGDIALPGKLDIDIAALKHDGCRTITFAGREAIEICFNRDGTWYHLYVLERGALPERLFGRKDALLTESGSAVAVWSDDRYDYAVVSPEGMAALTRLTA